MSASPRFLTLSAGPRLTGSRSAVLVGALALSVSLGGWIALVTAHWYVARLLPEPVDLSVYRGAAASLGSSPDALYTQGFGVASLPFIYPPFAALLFSLFDNVSAAAMAVLMTVASLVALAGALWASLGLLGERRGWRRIGICLLLVALALWLEPVQQDLGFGQVNLILLSVVMADLSLSDDRRWKGVGVGLAAGFKLTPLLFIVYLLVTRRFRAAAVAGATFAGTVVAGWVILPGASADFWTRSVAVQAVGTDYLANQSLYGMFLRLAGGNPTPATVCWLLACAMLAVPGLRAVRAASRSGRELLAICLTAALMLLVSPISWTHHWVWLAPALVLAADGAFGIVGTGRCTSLPTGRGSDHGSARSSARPNRTMWRLGSAALLVGLAAWPMRTDSFGTWDPQQPLVPYGLIWYVPHRDGRELQWDPFQTVVGNSYTLLGLAFVACVAYTLLRPAKSATLQHLVPEPSRPGGATPDSARRPAGIDLG